MNKALRQQKTHKAADVKSQKVCKLSNTKYFIALKQCGVLLLNLCLSSLRVEASGYIMVSLI